MENNAPKKKLICYVGKDGVAVLRCQKCEMTKAIDTNDKNYASKFFEERCECGALLTGQFEFRRYYRKKVQLPGFYRRLKTGRRGDIIVENISMMGVGFNCVAKHKVKEGDLLDITFTLDNPNQSKITLRVEVRAVNDRFVGVKRCDAQSLQPELGFYLK